MKIFSVGDRVKLVESNKQYLLGKTYTVIAMENTQCKLEDINGGTIWVEYDEIIPFGENDGKQKSVEQYKDEIAKLVEAMNREHGMCVTSLKVESVMSITEYGKVEDRNYKVVFEA